MEVRDLIKGEIYCLESSIGNQWIFIFNKISRCSVRGVNQICHSGATHKLDGVFRTPHGLIEVDALFTVRKATEKEENYLFFTTSNSNKHTVNFENYIYTTKPKFKIYI